MPAIVGNLPGAVQHCLCGQRFVFARTARSESGAGGKSMPLDHTPNPDGNVAVRVSEAGQLIARVLLKGEVHDPDYEVRAMPHFATCARRTARQAGSR